MPTRTASPLLVSPAVALVAIVLAASASQATAAGAPPPEVKPAPPPQVLIDPNDPNDPNLPANQKPAQAAAPAAGPPPDPAQVAKGEALFKDFCQKCHGIDMVSPGPPFFDLRTFPHDDKPRFVNSVTKGKGVMPAWGGVIKPAEIDALWAYVSAYKQAK